MPSSQQLQPDTQELILCPSDTFACETYLFEPGKGEERLGWLFAAAQTDDRGGVGSELLDTVMTAIQREYYRDPNRIPSTSFEMALHQANLILHDMAEQGMRDWMPSFSAVVAVLARSELHVSVAGHAQALLIRKNVLTDISTGLAHVPIVNPLQTFSQVASGVVSPLDALLFSTNPLTTVFAEAELTRSTTSQNAEQISKRLQGRYTDTHQTTPLAAVITTIMAQYAATKRAPTAATPPAPSRAGRAVNPSNLVPRQPLVVKKSFWQRTFSLIGGGAKVAGHFAKEKLMPWLAIGSRNGGRAIVQASKTTGKNIQELARGGTRLPDLKSLPKKTGKTAILAILGIGHRYGRLPKSSKIFAIISLLLVIALGASVILLQHKRAADGEIQQASEALNDAQTKTEAAKTALIYDNRDQAEGLLAQAKQTAEGLVAGDLYTKEAKDLLTEIESQYDRLQRVSRTTSDKAQVVGDFATEVKKSPTRIFFVDGALYTFDPQTNAVIRMTTDGTVTNVHKTTQGIGFFVDGAAHQADKTITITTDPAGVALFDSKDASLTSQDISFSASKPQIAAVGVFGNRLYILDKASSNIFVYNKTLRGYSSGSPWITDDSFPSTTITSFGIDGSIYTLHQDGTIRKLFKGVTDTDFEAEAVNPTIPSTAHLIVSDELSTIYVVDPTNKRIILYNKKGQLLRQILVDFAQDFSDAIPSPDENSLYVLDGTRVLQINLAE